MDDRPDDARGESRDDAVRRLLRSARATKPAPPDVVDRIDAALADAAREREEAGTEGRTPSRRVVPLRRQRVRNGLVAAAAVAAVVVLGGPVASQLAGGGSAGDAASSGVAAESAPEEQGDGGATALQDDAGEGGARSFAGGSGSQDRADGGAGPETGPRSAPLDSAAALVPLDGDDPEASVRAFVRSGAEGPPPTARCGAPQGPGTRLVGVRVDGTPGVLALRPGSGADAGSVVAELHLCGRPGTALRLVVAVG